MFDKLPNDINKKIIEECVVNMDSFSLYNLKNVNQNTREIIMDLKNGYEKQDNNDDDMNFLCCKKTSIVTFRWMFDNSIYLSLNHINNLIMNNRFDIIKLGYDYPNIRYILDNKFYLYSLEEENLKNPIYISAKHNRFQILDLLIRNSENNDKIIFIFDLSIKLNNKHLLNHCIHNYYDIIKDKLNRKINIIINQFNNIEDLLFYLYLNHKIKFTNRILINCIKKKYNSIFKYTFDTIEKKEVYLLFKTTVKDNNYDLFNYLLIHNKDEMDNHNFTNNIILNLDTKCDNTKYFIYDLLNNYKQKINKESSLIEKCILSDVQSNSIRRLIYEGYYYSYYEMKLALERKDIQLIRDLSNHFKG